jgi:hypothetical protein
MTFNLILDIHDIENNIDTTQSVLGQQIYCNADLIELFTDIDQNKAKFLDMITELNETQSYRNIITYHGTDIICILK